METNVQRVWYGNEEFDTWYACPGFFDTPAKGGPRGSRTVSSATVDVAPNGTISLLYVCEHCFRYTTKPADLNLHRKLCEYRSNPPGRVVYNSGDYQINYVDGADAKFYCQCMCLFGKLFLESKSIYFALEGFDFFVLSAHGRVLGFFSREKISWEDYNLACILVFPPFQRKGLGQLLIDYSYYLTRLAGKTGSPEKPLSKHGYASYSRYWAITVARTICLQAPTSRSLSIKQISRRTGIDSREVIQALEYMQALESGALTSGGTVYSISVRAVADWVRTARVSLNPYIDEAYCLV